MLTEPKPRKWFEEWREPGRFFRAADEGVKIFFVADKAPPQYLREAYVAGLFARIWRDDGGSCEVRVVPEREKFPDAQLRAGDASLNLEVTMALREGKRMFKEWRDLRAKAKQGEIVLAETSEQRQASAREAIPRVVGQKADKHYAGQAPTTLLVCTDDGRTLSAEEMARLTEPWKDRFEAIYLLCGMDVVMAWPTLCVLRGKEPF
ncbi:MAG: hypothetical protein IID53_13540 [Proteobacteria bacterium]|nr:hypothetical protein [Pseudomonadota bacterium]